MVDKTKLKPFSTSGTAPNLEGQWNNELGSVMTIESINGDTFSGTYESAVSADGTSVSGTLTGTFALDAISFAVNWSSSFNSVTTWAGQLLSDGQGGTFIYTLWLMTNNALEGDVWESIMAGSDLFKKLD